MAVRTVTVDLKLNAAAYLTAARAVVSSNRAVERSLIEVAMAANSASIQTDNMSRNLAQMSRRARTAERRVHNLREEIDRLIAAQAALAAGGPIPPLGSGVGGGGRGMLGMLGKVPAPVLAAVGAAIAATAPAIGSMIGGTLLTVLGGGALTIAIVSAVKDVKVRAAFGEFGEFLKEEFISYGQAFDVPLIAAAERFQDRFATMSPKIRGVLAEMSVAVGPLVDGLIGFMEKAGPGIADGLRGSLPVLAAIAAELPDLGQAAGDFFKLIGAGSEGAADGMVALLELIELTGYAVGGQILYWEQLFALLGNLGPVVAGFLGPAGALLGGGDSIIIPLRDMGYQADDTADAFDRLTQSTKAMTDGFNSQFSAAIAYEEALDGLAESVKENGRSMDISTEKGRANARALMEAFEAAEKTYAANIKSGMSAQQAAAQYNAQIEKARQTALAAGMAADQVNALAAAQRNLPTGKTIINTVITVYREVGGPNYGRTPGRQVAQRDGGIVYARDGMMAFGRASGIASGGRPLIGFAEPGTGGEAFIARNAPASRSLAIANTAAGWHGGMVVPRGAGNTTNVNVNVYAGMGTNGRDVGEQIIEVLQPVINRRGGKVQFAVMGKE